MNIKINEELHKELCKLDFKEYLFGSQLHGIADENSDFDYIRVISDNFYNRFNTYAKWLPNIHSWQFDGEGVQYIWMTESQFWRGFFSGDGNNLADIVILSGEFENPLLLSRTYKIIKAFLGVAKRDLKLHGNVNKKRFHAMRSLYMAESLINGHLPLKSSIQALALVFKDNPPPKEKLSSHEQELRERLNNMLNKGEITLYPVFKEEDRLAEIINKSNNIREFRYEDSSNGGM